MKKKQAAYIEQQAVESGKIEEQISDIRYQEKQGQRNSKNRKQKSFQMYLCLSFLHLLTTYN